MPALMVQVLMRMRKGWKWIGDVDGDNENDDHNRKGDPDNANKAKT